MGRSLRAGLLACLLASVLAPAASAAPGSGDTAVVSLGDSYISGEAGRWEGNSVNPVGDNDGTDRACVPDAPLCSREDKSRVYVDGSAENGCHRSDVAEVHSSGIGVDERINLACSGARTENILKASNGGVGQNGEAPQADQLLPVARSKDVKLIVVSIGGNDLGFASIVRDCLTAYETRTGPCKDEQQRKIDAAVPGATRKVARIIDEIRGVMRDAGYGPGDFRLVLQTYPSVVPKASEARYGENDPQRTTQGCPFYDEDLTWARTQAAPQIGSMVKAAADSRGVEILELIDALQGHEICSRDARAATPTERVDMRSGEWGRFTGASTVQQGDLQEAFHPNAFAQRALGRCLGEVYGQAPGKFACAGRAGIDAGGMRFGRIGDVAPRSDDGGSAAPGGGTAGSGGRRCVPADGFRSVAANPRGRGLRIAVSRAQRRPFDVAVFAQSSGRRVLANRLVARFRSRRGSFTWSGRGRRVRDGAYVVRVTMRLDRGRTDVRRIVVRRSRGRFAAAPAYYRRTSCGVLSSFKLERPVFGGTSRRALGIAFRVATAAQVEVVVTRGGRVVRRYAPTARTPRTTHRLRLPAAGLRRGLYRVQVVVTPPGGAPVTATLAARRI